MYSSTICYFFIMTQATNCADEWEKTQYDIAVGKILLTATPPSEVLSMPVMWRRLPPPAIPESTAPRKTYRKY